MSACERCVVGREGERSVGGVVMCGHCAAEVKATLVRKKGDGRCPMKVCARCGALAGVRLSICRSCGNNYFRVI